MLFLVACLEAKIDTAAPPSVDVDGYEAPFGPSRSVQTSDVSHAMFGNNDIDESTCHGGWHHELRDDPRHRASGSGRRKRNNEPAAFGRVCDSRVVGGAARTRDHPITDPFAVDRPVQRYFDGGVDGGELVEPSDRCKSMSDRGGNHDDVGVAVHEVVERASAADHRSHDLAGELRMFRSGERT